MSRRLILRPTPPQRLTVFHVVLGDGRCASSTLSLSVALWALQSWRRNGFAGATLKTETFAVSPRPCRSIITPRKGGAE